MSRTKRAGDGAGRLVAVLDIGKTTCKLALVPPSSGLVVWSRERAIAPLAAPPFRRLDVAGIERWLLDALRAAPDRAAITDIVPVAHGAAAVLLDQAGRTLPVVDYEEPALEEVAALYAPLRDGFAQTFSPPLALGLNLGRQLFFLEQRHAELWAAAKTILPYPQYWAYRLSGVAAGEVTSLGTHTDLWCPLEMDWSPLAKRRGWAAMMPLRRPAGAALGTVLPEVAAATGLHPDCAIRCGIHDSNASFLRHRQGRDGAAPGTAMAVLSTGTWFIAMATGVPLSRLDPARDMLANVDAFGQPVPTARFMGGREHDILCQGQRVPAGAAELDIVLGRGAMAIPSFAPAGPLAGCRGRLIAAEGLAPAERSALATLYVALVSELMLEALGVRAVTIEGPLAFDPLFPPLLAALMPGSPVKISDDRAGTIGGALLLVDPQATLSPAKPVAALDRPSLAHYRARWREAVLREPAVSLPQELPAGST